MHFSFQKIRDTNNKTDGKKEEEKEWSVSFIQSWWIARTIPSNDKLRPQTKANTIPIRWENQKKKNLNETQKNLFTRHIQKLEPGLMSYLYVIPLLP